jgi:DNA adenine methylase
LEARARAKNNLSVARSPQGRTKENLVATPFLKWAGGKSQLLKTFSSYYPSVFGRYFEPFVGGGAVFFALAAKQGNGFRATISDCNQELINCYATVRDHLEELLEALRKHRNDKHHFYAVRGSDVARLSAIDRAARLIYLNKTCFNGLYRVNRSGQFNVPFGKYKNPRIVDETNLRLASRVLQNADVLCSPFENTLSKTKAGDFVYLDPPYQPVSATSNFTSYTSASFGLQDQERLADFVHKLDKRGCHVMVSNSDNELIQQLYARFKVHKVTATRAINCKGNLRGRINELLITNY